MPPPATVRVPVTVGVKVSEFDVGTMVVPKVSPLKERVEVAKVIEEAGVVAQPEPRFVSEEEVLTKPRAPLVQPRIWPAVPEP